MAVNLVRFTSTAGHRWGVMRGADVIPLAGDYQTTASLIERGEILRGCDPFFKAEYPSQFLNLVRFLVIVHSRRFQKIAGFDIARLQFLNGKRAFRFAVDDENVAIVGMLQG